MTIGLRGLQDWLFRIMRTIVTPILLTLALVIVPQTAAAQTSIDFAGTASCRPDGLPDPSPPVTPTIPEPPVTPTIPEPPVTPPFLPIIDNCGTSHWGTLSTSSEACDETGCQVSASAQGFGWASTPSVLRLQMALVSEGDSAVLCEVRGVSAALACPASGQAYVAVGMGECRGGDSPLGIVTQLWVNQVEGLPHLTSAVVAPFVLCRDDEGNPALSVPEGCGNCPPSPAAWAALIAVAGLALLVRRRR
jgi:MYXO-CTERM domain-containing protein